MLASVDIPKVESSIRVNSGIFLEVHTRGGKSGFTKIQGGRVWNNEFGRAGNKVDKGHAMHGGTCTCSSLLYF